MLRMKCYNNQVQITPDNEQVLSLIEPKSGDLVTGRIFELLQDVRAENLWLANFASENTREAYKRAVASFIATIGIEDADELYSVTQAHVIAWRTAMEQAGLSQASIANRLSALSSLYRHLTDQRLALQNPVSGVKRPKTGNAGIGAGKSPALTRKQVRALFEAVHEAPRTPDLQKFRDSALLHIYFYTGARCSEPGRLKIKDFRFDREYSVLDFTIKGGKRNTVAIHPECAETVRSYLNASDHGIDPETWLFQPIKNGKVGASLTRNQFYHLFDKYARLAGLPEGVYPHVARATMITEAYEAGATGEAIQRTVGHSSITTTEGYNHTAKKHRESASLKMGY